MTRDGRRDHVSLGRAKHVAFVDVHARERKAVEPLGLLRPGG